jgi:hypothetical protein
MFRQGNSQVQFLQLVCVVLVMATLIGLVGAYIFFRDVQNMEAELAGAKSQADRFKNEIVESYEEVKVLKDVMGYPLAVVGDENSIEGDTVVGKVRSDINRMVGPLPKATLRDALIALHDRWQNTQQENRTLKEQVEKLSSVPSRSN